MFDYIERKQLRLLDNEMKQEFIYHLRIINRKFLSKSEEYE